MLRTCYPRSGRRPPTQVGDPSPKGRVGVSRRKSRPHFIVAFGNAPFRRKVAYLICDQLDLLAPTDGQLLRNMNNSLKSIIERLNWQNKE
ncbi:MAG: hypothetical protein LBB88_07710, partial [Planctomycetaceae bacterium]|nr:hypothetical protein [Planctomycetaceae bacterium]